MSAEDMTASRVQSLLSEILDVPPESIGPEFSQATAATWTSLNHLMLVSQIEAEFGLMLSNKEITELTSFERIVDALTQRRTAGG